LTKKAFCFELIEAILLAIVEKLLDGFLLVSLQKAPDVVVVDERQKQAHKVDRVGWSDHFQYLTKNKSVNYIIEILIGQIPKF
jgi:hypothetical protein